MTMRMIMISVLSLLCQLQPLHACDHCRSSAHLGAGQSVAYVPTTGVQTMFVSGGTPFASVPVVAAPVPVYPVYGQSLAMAPQVWGSSSGVYYPTAPAYASATDPYAQGLISDLIFGLARPTACEVCRSMGCQSGGGGGAAGDSVKSLRESIEEIGEIIRAVKGLEKSLKDAVGENTDAPRPPGHSSAQSQIARLTEIRDQVRALERPLDTTQVADGRP